MMDHIVNGHSSGSFTMGINRNYPVQTSCAGNIFTDMSSSYPIQVGLSEIVKGDAYAPNGNPQYNLSGSVPYQTIINPINYVPALVNPSSSGYYNFRGQNLEEFEVGDLVEIVPTIPNEHQWPYLPTTHKVGPNLRPELYRLEKVEPGMVVKKYKRSLKDIFEESDLKKNENNQYAYEMSKINSKIVNPDIDAIILVVMLDEIIVEVHSPRCDPVKSLIVRKRVFDPELE